MPSEPFPWPDRRDFFRDRRHSHERPPDSFYLTGGPSPPAPPGSRWRDSYGFRAEFPRWGYGPEFRRPPGHGKQGNWNVYPDEPPYDYSIPRSGSRYYEDDGFRPYVPRGDGRYGRNYRDNSGSFSQKEWRGSPSENNYHQHSTSAGASARQHEVNDHRSVDNLLLHDSPHSDSSKILDEHHHKHHHQASMPCEGNGSGMGQRVDKETSLGTDWRPLNWSRTGSLTSRGSEFKHSSGSRSIAHESSEMMGELLVQNPAPVESLLGDPFPSMASETPLGETSSRKKPRLGWGEGLAKYEKKKVAGPDDDTNKIAETSCTHDAEVSCSVATSQADRCPNVGDLADCASPTILPPAVCSSLPAKEDKLLMKVADMEIDANNMCASPLTCSDVQNVVSSFSLEELEPSTLTNLNTMLVELLQSEVQNSANPGFVGTSAQDRLILWKREITKALEHTESEIDSLENELRSFRSKHVLDNLSLFPSGSSSIHCGEQSQKQFNMILGPQSIEVLPSGVDSVDIMTPCGNTTGINNNEDKAEVADSPGTVTFKLVEPPFLENSEIPDELTSICSLHIADVNSADHGNSPLASTCDIKISEGSSGVISSMMVQEGLVLNESNEYPTTGDNDGIEKILASNKMTAEKASELFLNSLPTSDYHDYKVNLVRATCKKVRLLVKNKIFQRKQFLKFKEKVTYFKYKAFMNLWNEDLRLLTSRKYRAKSQKKVNKSVRILHNGHKECRSSIRSRYSSPAGSSNVVPRTDIISLTTDLLSNSHVEHSRDDLKIPALILDEKERVLSRFISHNGLVEDPCAVEKERTLTNPWTPEEREIFIDKLANFGKDFLKIATFLDHKTVADCIDFYYKNHKSESFERTKRKPELKLDKSLSANTYLVTSGKRWRREMNSVPLDLLGEASALAAREDCDFDAAISGSGRFNRKLRGVSSSFGKSSSYDFEDDRETAVADVLAGMCGSLSSEAVSSCITSSVDPGEGCQDLKSQRFNSSSRHPLTSEVTQNIDEETCSHESCAEMVPVDWTDAEKSLFLQAFTTYGKDFLLISRQVRTKSRDQCKVFFSKAKKCLGLEMVCPGPRSGHTPVIDDENSSGAETDDACVVEAGSIVSSDKYDSRMDEDLLVSTPDKVPEGITFGATDLQCEMKMVGCCDTEKLEKLHWVDQKANDISHITSDGKFRAHKVETSMVVQNEGNATDVALGAEVKITVGHDAAKVDIAAEALDASTPSVLVAFMENNATHEVPGKNLESEPVNKQVGNQAIPSAENDRETSEDDVNNQSASTDLRHLSAGQAFSGHHESSSLGLSIKSNVNGIVMHLSQKNSFPVQTGSITESNVQSQVSYIRKCSNLGQDSVGEPNFVPGTVVHSNRSECQLASLDMRCRNGDVKLFGQILNKPSSMCRRQPKGNGVLQSSSVCLLDKKESVTCNLNEESIVPECDRATDKDNENIPVKNYAGMMVRTSYSFLADSEKLLGKNQQTLKTKQSPSNGAYRSSH